MLVCLLAFITMIIVLILQHTWQQQQHEKDGIGHAPNSTAQHTICYSMRAMKPQHTQQEAQSVILQREGFEATICSL